MVESLKNQYELGDRLDEVNSELQVAGSEQLSFADPALGVNAACSMCWTAARDNAWAVTRRGEWTDNRCVDKLAGKIALMHSELSEALEALRVGDEPNGKEEIADCLIRIFDFCGGLQWDMEEEIIKKLAANRSRGVRHGGKRL